LSAKKKQEQDAHTQKLEAVGITGTSDIDPRKVSSKFLSL
jgi:hypothetical protein